jgi:hypothetical protein
VGAAGAALADALRALAPDLVLANAAYLPLAAAAQAGIASAGMCSLNWADLAAQIFAGEDLARAGTERDAGGL